MVRKNSLMAACFVLILAATMTAGCAAPEPAAATPLPPLAENAAGSGPGLVIEVPAAVKAGDDSIRVAVRALNVANLIAAELHLSFDPAAVEVLALKSGDFLKADFTVQNTFDNANGTIDYALAQIGRSPASGSGVLLEIVIRARQSGGTQIRFRGTDAVPSGALLSDPNGQGIQVTLTDGVLQINAP